MSVSHKSSNTQMFRLMVYGRALHPELFDVQIRRSLRHNDYEAEVWLTPGGHVVRFQHGGTAVTETVLEEGDHLPEMGLIHALPCLGEKDYEMEPHGGLCYVTTVQTEMLIENLYAATLREMRTFAEESGALSYEWTDEEGASCLSLVDVQKYLHELHIQSYHLAGSSGLVLRTQSIFETV